MGFHHPRGMKFDKEYFDTMMADFDGVPSGPTEVKSYSPIRRDPPIPEDFAILEEGKRGGVKFNALEVIRYLGANEIVFDHSIPRRFDGRVYSEIPTRDVEDLIIRACYKHGYAVTPYDIKTVINLAETLLPPDLTGFPDPEMAEPYERDNGLLIAFENGVLNVITGELLPFTPYLYLTYYLHAKYDPTITTAPSKSVIEGIISQQETIDFFYEMCGYIFFHPTLNPPSIFMLYGPGNTGKSALANLIRTIMGNTVAQIGLSQLTAKFTVAELEGKRLNICGETGDASSRETHFDGELLKRLTDGDTVLVERKGERPYYIRNTAKFLFVTNTPPDFGDNSSGLFRRLYEIPCRNRQDEKAQIYDILTSEESRSWLINQSLLAWKLFCKNGYKFTISSQMEVEHAHYKAQDSVMEFLQNLFDSTSVPVVAHKITTDDNLCYTTILYDAYRENCAEGGNKPLSRKKFVEKIRNEYNLKTKVVYYAVGFGLDVKRTTKTKFIL